MSAQNPLAARRMTAPQITARKGREPIVCLTAYTAPVAAILDEVCDLLLVLLRRSLTPWRPRRARREVPEVLIGQPAPAFPRGAA